VDLGETGPISFSLILDRMFAVYRRYFLVLVSVAGMPYALVAIIITIPILAVGSAGQQGANAQPVPDPVFFLGVFAFIAGVFFLGAVFAWVATSVAAWDVQMGQKPRILRSYGFALRRSGTILVAGFLGLLGIAAGYILLVIPGIFVALSISLTWSIIAAEQKGPIESLRRSWELSRGYRWKIFLAFFMCGIFSAVISYAILIPAMILLGFASAGGTQPIWATVVFLLAYILGLALPAPLLVIALSLIYYDARVRKEGFDLQRMLDALPPAAGTQAPQTPAVS
jgi:hypothetical protein